MPSRSFNQSQSKTMIKRPKSTFQKKSTHDKLSQNNHMSAFTDDDVEIPNDIVGSVVPPTGYFQASSRNNAQSPGNNELGYFAPGF